MNADAQHPKSAGAVAIRWNAELDGTQESDMLQVMCSRDVKRVCDGSCDDPGCMAKHRPMITVACGGCDALRRALEIAEAALADIGDADRELDDDIAWCEQRAASVLPEIRAALAVPPNNQI